MRTLVPAAVVLLAACATLPPLRPADPAQAVENDKFAGTAFSEGIRIVVRPAAWKGGDDVEQYLTPVEVAIHNDSGRAVQVRPASFSLLVPGGFRYDALTREEVRRALGPMRTSVYGGYAFVPWGAPFYPWGGPYGGWWGWGGFGPSPWLGPVIYYGGPSSGRIPRQALTQGTLEPGGDATILLFFPIPAENLDALALDASLSDTSGRKLAELRVPFVREGRHAQPVPLPPTAQPEGPASAQPPGQPGTWQTVPPPPPATTPPPPPQETPPPPQQPPVDTPAPGAAAPPQ